MRLHKKQDPYIFLALPIIAYLAVVIVPIASSIYYSFMDWNGIGAMQFTGIDNYLKMFRDSNLLTCVINTLKYSLVGTVCQVGGGLFLAILVQRVRKGGNLVRVLLFSPVEIGRAHV